MHTQAGGGLLISIKKKEEKEWMKHLCTYCIWARIQICIYIYEYIHIYTLTHTLTHIKDMCVTLGRSCLLVMWRTLMVMIVIMAKRV